MPAKFGVGSASRAGQANAWYGLAERRDGTVTMSLKLCHSFISHQTFAIPMNCSELTQVIERRMPDASPREVARILTVMLSAETASDQEPAAVIGEKCWERANLTLRSAMEQHEAITRELEDLANSDPKQFTPDQVWTLIRAIKVQNQLLRLCWHPMGEPSTENT